MKDKIVTIFGLGQYPKGSGISAAKYFAPYVKKLIVTDSKTKKELVKNVKALSKYKNIVWHMGGHKREDFVKTDWVVRNPGVRSDNKFLKLARDKGIRICNDVTLFLYDLPSMGNVIGVTGTRGKTTTSHLISQMIKGSLLGGNVGVSPLNFLAKAKKGAPVVLELSSFLLHDFDTIKKSPHIAVWTTLYPDHLNAYKSMRQYIGDKKRIYRYQESGDFLVINDDDVRLRELQPKTKGSIIKYSTRRRVKRGAFVAGSWIMYTDGGSPKRIASRKDVKVPGEHNLSNVLAAVCAAKAYGVSTPVIKKAIKNFKGVPYRLERVRSLRGVDYVNDTTATTPEGAIAGLRSFDSGKVVLITGGNSKGLDLEEFAQEISARAKAVVLLPGDENKNLPAGVNASNMKEAVHAAQKLAQKGDTVLLSPGLSWLPLMNEFERGDEFSKAVRSLPL